MQVRVRRDRRRLETTRTRKENLAITYTPPGVEPSQPTAPAPAPKTSGHAIAGLVVGLGGLCTCGVGGIAGLILSIVALKKIDASRGTLAPAGVLILVAALAASGAAEVPNDLRDIRTGLPITAGGYADQPYVVVLPDGAWLCVLTTGAGREGAAGQHVVALRSTDHGRTWSAPVDIEPADGPDASWAVPLLTPYGRVYAFYDYNGDRVSTLGGKKIRVDMLGWYCYRYSDDGGRTWSAERYRLPMRLTACDRANDWGGKVQIFWGVCKPVAVGGEALFTFTKLGKYMLEQGEGWLYRSDNILTERDVSKLRWDLWPEGDHGIRAPEFGSVQEEHNFVPLSDGSLYCAYRTTTGHPCFSISRDGGRTWSVPAVMTYADGRPMFHNRACPRLWRTAAGKFLFWFDNHGGKSYEDRNPVWLASGVEKDGRLLWSQPEILLYDPDPKVRMSYPDLIEQDGRTWVTETQKTVARVHEIDPALLDGLWRQAENCEAARRGLALDLPADRCTAGATAAMPPLADLAQGGGLTLDVWVRLNDLEPGQTLFDTMTPDGKGVRFVTAADGAVRLELADGKTRAAWDSDAGLLKTGTWHHIVAIVDGGPKIITFIIDGCLCDGGGRRQFGWGRFPPELGDVSGRAEAALAPSLHGQLGGLRLYDRYLRTSEAVGNFRAGRPVTPK